ncbi:MAG: putative 6-oxopurine nucleoside phosphorylase [Candidatus Heimdallarchaeota archaeon LC_2]|nr:MAG: putative 6-oxopurine nucleoside phosphorylase [Candidatus Heimdallarchaeota archaeon LC_2]
MIGIIGGSGFYSFLENPKVEKIQTPFGEISIYLDQKDGKDILFIPRHGSGHSILPSRINYRANIYAAHLKNVERIYATNAVGTSNQKINPGVIVILDQIIDVTNGRDTSFFTGDDFSIITRSGRKLSGVVHTDVSEPFDNNVRRDLLNACKHYNQETVDGGTVAVFNGPRYETPAEVRAYTTLGARYFGMTSAPEAFLAKEIEIPYATLAVVTNYAAGLQSTVTHDEVDSLFKNRITDVKNILNYAIKNY